MRSRLASPVATAVLALTACGGTPTVAPDPNGAIWDPGSGSHGSSSAGGGSSSDDAGSAVIPEAGAPEAQAPPRKIPPISAAAPTTTPAACAGGASPSAYLWESDGTLLSLDLVTLETRALGVVTCPARAFPWALTVTTSDTAYVEYDDSSLFQISLSSLDCQATGYQSGQLGLNGYNEGITLGAGDTADRLYVYGETGTSSTTLLGVSDPSSFRLFQLGPPTSLAPPMFAVDLKSDAWGRLFALGVDGTLDQLDPATGVLLGEDHTGFHGPPAHGTLLTYDGQLYFFGGTEGAMSRYDVAGKGLFPLGQINQTLVDVSATPCLSAAAMPGAAADAGVDSGAPAPASPFSSGDAWMGTYVCQQGLTDLAFVIESVDGNSIDARFDFDWVAGGAQGSYELTGTFDPTTREATFTPGSWVSQPSPAWSPVGMAGYVDLSGRTFSGNITYAGCGAFSVSL